MSTHSSSARRVRRSRVVVAASGHAGAVVAVSPPLGLRRVNFSSRTATKITQTRSARGQQSSRFHSIAFSQGRIDPSSSAHGRKEGLSSSQAVLKSVQFLDRSTFSPSCPRRTSAARTHRLIRHDHETASGRDRAAADAADVDHAFIRHSNDVQLVGLKIRLLEHAGSACDRRNQRSNARNADDFRDWCNVVRKMYSLIAGAGGVHGDEPFAARACSDPGASPVRRRTDGIVPNCLRVQ